MNVKFVLLFVLISFGSNMGLAQAPINDECQTAIVIEDPSNYCSGFAAFSNAGATPSPFDAPSCFDISNDVWFAFTAVATDIVVTVNGASSNGSGGTLEGPSISLYTGNCSNLSELECQAGNAANFTDLTQSGVTVGSFMFVRVEGIGNFTGTFDLCIQNFNPPIDPSSDCVDGAILCDKSTFTVDQLVGAGNDPNDFAGAPCFSGSGGNLALEFNSVWFRWTCDQPGSLVFTLTPLRPVADLDFVLYELPGGLDDCANKQLLRCEAAGAAEALYPTPCHGPTGLSFDAQDNSEPFNCDMGQDNFVAPINMVSGRSYALGVNNFGPGTEGFTIEFDGTGTFLGPQPAFAAQPPTVPCLEEVVFTDASSFANGSIVGWSWNFGQDASPQTALSQGPHAVTYNSWGTKFITLTVESDEGCITTQVIPFEVTECCLPSVDDLGVDLINAIDPLCNGFNTGLILVEGSDGNPYFVDTTANADTYYLYTIDDGPLQTSSAFSGLVAGEYDIVVFDRFGCEERINVPINQPPPIIVEAGPDITVNLGETADLNAFYTPEIMGDTIYWTPDSLMDCTNCLDPNVLPAGSTTYEIVVQNEDGCLDVDSITVFVTENRPLFIPNGFTPNFDGVNDYFNVYTGAAVDFIESMEIYDRWGNLIYRGTDLEANNPNVGWDGTFRGKDLNPSVFAYVIHVRFIDGVVLLYEGDVTLVR